MWDLPEPVYPALAGGFLTTAPPGKSKKIFFLNCLAHLTLQVCEGGGDFFSCSLLYLQPIVQWCHFVDAQ